MNTGFLGPAVATVPTVYGIETPAEFPSRYFLVRSLQQYLPFTVLKQTAFFEVFFLFFVATVPTVYGIET